MLLDDFLGIPLSQKSTEELLREVQELQASRASSFLEQKDKPKKVGKKKEKDPLEGVLMELLKLGVPHEKLVGLIDAGGTLKQLEELLQALKGGN